MAVGNLATVSYEMEADRRKLAFMTRNLDFQLLRDLDKNGDGVDKFEFVIGILTQMG